MFSRIRSSLTTEASNRLYKSMILPNLEYCCAVFHGCGKGIEEELERLQRCAARIVLKTVHLSTQDMASGLGWDPHKTRREKHIVKLVKNCLDGQASYFSDYFRRRAYDIHDYDTRSKDRLYPVAIVVRCVEPLNDMKNKRRITTWFGLVYPTSDTMSNLRGELN